MAIFAQRLRGRRANPDVVIFQRGDQRLHPFFRPQPHDGLNRRQAHRRRFVGQRKDKLIGEPLFAELSHQRDGLLSDHRIAVLRGQQQFVVIALALNVDVRRKRVEFHRQRGRLQKLSNFRQHRRFHLREHRHERRHGIDRRLLRRDVGVIELDQEVIDGSGMVHFSDRVDGQPTDHRIVVIEEGNDAGNGLGAVKGVQHTQKERDHFVLLRVVQRLQNRREGRRSEVDERLRRHFGRIRFFQTSQEHGQCARISGPAEELEDKALHFAFSRRLELPDQRLDLCGGK